MKRTLLCTIACLTVFSVILSGCANGQTDNDLQSSVPETKTVSSDSQNNEDTTLQIQVETDSERIVFALNDSSAARALYDQLPFTLPVEDYSTNEKIFYPPEKLDVSGAPPAEGPAGTLAYYEPWGDVVMFYEACSGASGLYALGKAISGTEQIENLSGKIRIEKIEVSPQNSEATSQGTKTSSSSTLNSSSTARPNSSASIGSDPTNASNRPAGATSAMIEDKTSSAPTATKETERTMRNIEIAVNGELFAATLYDNETARALAKRLPLTLNMKEMNGNEKYYYLNNRLPTNSSNPGRINNGDFMLYGSDCLVLFYKDFSTSYSYTPLGHLDNPTGLANALGSGNVTVTFRIR